jgi:tetratricopeptide (TPR) repeat protein
MNIAKSLKTQMRVAPLIGRKDYEGALRILEGEITGTAEDMLYLEIIVFCHLETGNQEKAIETAKKALALNPTSFEMPKMLSQLFAEREDHEQAVKYVKIGLSNYPTEVPPVPPNWACGLLKLAGKFSPRWKRVEEATKDDFRDPDKDRREWQVWAQEYLTWYDEFLKNSSNQVAADGLR